MHRDLRRFLSRISQSPHQTINLSVRPALSAHHGQRSPDVRWPNGRDCLLWLQCLRHPLHLALRLWSAGRRVTLAGGAVVFRAGDRHHAMSFARRERGRLVGCSGFAVFCFATSALGVLAAFEALHARGTKKARLDAGYMFGCGGLIAGRLVKSQLQLCPDRRFPRTSETTILQGQSRRPK